MTAADIQDMEPEQVGRTAKQALEAAAELVDLLAAGRALYIHDGNTIDRAALELQVATISSVAKALRGDDMAVVGMLPSWEWENFESLRKQVETGDYSVDITTLTQKTVEGS